MLLHFQRWKNIHQVDSMCICSMQIFRIWCLYCMYISNKCWFAWCDLSSVGWRHASGVII